MSATNVDARTRRSVTIILLVASFISLASQTMMVTALPVIKNDLHVSLADDRLYAADRGYHAIIVKHLRTLYQPQRLFINGWDLHHRHADWLLCK